MSKQQLIIEPIAGNDLSRTETQEAKVFYGREATLHTFFEEPGVNRNGESILDFASLFLLKKKISALGLRIIEISGIFDRDGISPSIGDYYAPNVDLKAEGFIHVRENIILTIYNGQNNKPGGTVQLKPNDILVETKLTVRCAKFILEKLGES